jgi:hypothetical protein
VVQYRQLFGFRIVPVISFLLARSKTTEKSFNVEGRVHKTKFYNIIVEKEESVHVNKHQLLTQTPSATTRGMAVFLSSLLIFLLSMGFAM